MRRRGIGKRRGGGRKRDMKRTKKLQDRSREREGEPSWEGGEIGKEEEGREGEDV